MKKALMNWWLDGGFDSSYQAVLDRATALGYTLPSAAQQVKQNTLLSALKSNGIWSLLDVFYVFATDGDRNFAELNWVSPTQYKISEAGTMTFTPNDGFNIASALNSHWLDTGYIPGSANYTQNNCSIGCHVSSTGVNTGAICGNFGTNHSYLRWSQRSLCSNTSHLISNTIATKLGFFHLYRKDATNLYLYQNGALLNNDATPSDGIDAVSFYVCRANGLAAIFDGRVSMFFAGASLTTKESALYSAWNTYITGL